MEGRYTAGVPILSDICWSTHLRQGVEQQGHLHVVLVRGQILASCTTTFMRRSGLEAGFNVVQVGNLTQKIFENQVHL